MINKQNLSVSAFGERYGVKGILISDNFTAATNGKVLVIVNRPADDPAEFPVSPDGTPAQPKQGRYMITKEDAERIAKAIPKSKSLSILANAMPLAPTEESRRFLIGDLDSMQVMMVRPINSQFPSLTHKKLWPKTKPKMEITFSVELLGQLLAAIKKASTKTFPIVTFKFYKPDGAARFSCELTDEGQKMTGLIMPVKK